MAKHYRSAEYLVHVSFPLDPRDVSRTEFVKAPPNVPFLRDYETDGERMKREKEREYRAAIAEMVRDPK